MPAEPSPADRALLDAPTDSHLAMLDKAGAPHSTAASGGSRR